MSNDLKQRIMSHVQEDVIAIEAALRENLDTHLPIVSDVAGHILFSGGKRLRPLLMVLSARLCGYDGGREIFFSTIFEYLHTATLLHDDLVDGAGLRRGRAAAHSVWGNEVAVLVGDFLLARSLTIASETGMTDVIKVIAGITENMSQGEIHQLTRKKNLDLTEAEYLEIIRRKTAVLMEGACRVGALISDAAEEWTAAIAAYGCHLGIAFQMADDLLDYTSDTAVLGKAVGTDLREGKLTLPVIRALSAAGEKDRKTMARIITDDDFSVDDFNTLVRLMTSLGGIEDTLAAARHHVAAAKAALSIFVDSPDRGTLEGIADYALSRTH